MRATLTRCLAVTSLFLACAVARAQDAAAGGGVTQPKLMARDADPGWEVVTVRPSDPNETNQSFRVEGRHVLIQRQTVEYMLMVAFGLQKNQILNVPDWVKTENFDADGVPDTEGQPSVQQFQVMVRKLLEERFGLKAHKEQREMEVYALRVGKDGPKLAPTQKRSECIAQPGCIWQRHGADAEVQERVDGRFCADDVVRGPAAAGEPDGADGSL